MIVDCHTHISCESADSVHSQHLEASEPVDVCIVLAESGESNERANKAVSEYAGKYRDKIVGFGVVDPRSDNVGVKSVGALREKDGLSGVVVYCSSSGFHPCHSRAMRFYEAAEEVGLPVFFHTGSELDTVAVLSYDQPVLLDEVAREFPNLKIIVGSMGMPFVSQTLSLVSKHKNVYADLTVRPSRVWEVYNTMVAAYECGVMEKLVFGSGYPDGKANECIETLLGFNKLLADTNLPTVPRGEIRNIIERDVLELLGISR